MGVKKFYQPERHKALRPIVREAPSFDESIENMNLAIDARFKPEAPQLATGPRVNVPEVIGARIGAPTKGRPFNPAPNADGAKLATDKGWN